MDPSPSYGDMAFTVPLFDEFMIRAMSVFITPIGSKSNFESAWSIKYDTELIFC